MDNKIVTVSAPGRIDLCGGPTDWCGGNTLAMAINLRATAKARLIDQPNTISLAIGDEKITYTKAVYDGKLDLLKAVIELTGLSGFSIEYSTNIPKGSGLGGSAPLTVCTVFALNKLFSKNWSRHYMAELAQRAETYKLHTVNGYQDQYAATFGGVHFMDFRGKSCQRNNYSKTVEEEPYATIENLTPFLPKMNIVIAIPPITREGSGQTNGSLSDRYLNGEEKIVGLINQMIRETQNAKKYLIDGNINSLYDSINKDNDALRHFDFLTQANEKIIEIAFNQGALACKTCGAGRGAVAIFLDKDKNANEVVDTLKGCTEYTFIVENDEGARYENE